MRLLAQMPVTKTMKIGTIISVNPFSAERRGKRMRKIVLDIPSGIHARNMERMLMQKLDDYQIIISASPDETAEWCKTHSPDVLLMEVKAYSPWMFGKRMKIRDRIKKDTPNCRIILFVDDESDSELTEKVRQAKREGLIDAFLFGSVSENYFRRNSSWLTLVQSAEHPSTFSSLKSSRTETISAAKLAVKRQCATLIL